jgi:hypothetical protein
LSIIKDTNPRIVAEWNDAALGYSGAPILYRVVSTGQYLEVEQSLDGGATFESCDVTADVVCLLALKLEEECGGAADLCDCALATKVKRVTDDLMATVDLLRARLEAERALLVGADAND